jgi:hypothetical protein
MNCAKLFAAPCVCVIFARLVRRPVYVCAIGSSRIELTVDGQVSWSCGRKLIVVREAQDP